MKADWLVDIQVVSVLGFNFTINDHDHNGKAECNDISR